MKEREEREINPLEFLRRHREKGQIKKEDGFLNMGVLNMVLEDLPDSAKEALLILFTKTVSSYLDTGRMPVIMPMDESGTNIGSVKINQN